MSMYMSKFQAGDFVVCTEAEASYGFLRAGSTYKVAGVTTPGHVRLEGSFDYWNQDRFKLAPEKNTKTMKDVEIHITGADDYKTRVHLEGYFSATQLQAILNAALTVE